MKTHRLPVPIVPIALALLCLSLSACGSAGIFRTANSRACGVGATSIPPLAVD